MNEKSSAPSNIRSNQQNKSLHLYCEQLADALDREGHSMQDVVKEIRKAQIRPTKENVKAVLWRPMQEALFGSTSTTHLTRGQLDKVYEALNHFIGTHFHIHVPFPSEESKKDDLL